MKMESVKSSNIKAIGYDKGSKVLRIEFNSGYTYDYYPVRKEVYDKLLASESKGKFFSENIKSNQKYSYQKV